jgi:hypothetical protein
MKTALSNGNSNTEALRRREKDELNAQLSSMGLTESISFLKQSFKCSAEKGGQVLKKDYITGTKSFLGKLKISNQCQFHPATTVDIRHIAGYCCNTNYDSCPLYQLYTCTNKLMSWRGR